jgi:hypothetical protein
MTKKDRVAVIRWILALGILSILVGLYFTYPWLRTRVGRMWRLSEWLRDPSAHTDWMVRAGEACGHAPFIMPTSGYIGFVWGDSFKPGTKHQGIDIFGGEQPGKTPVLAAYEGYLTRLPDWKSTVFVKAGTFLGYQGDYSGDPNNPVGVHLHFSIVMDDGQGGFLNELKIENTLDPSPYLGFQLNASQNANQPVTCDQGANEQ